MAIPFHFVDISRMFGTEVAKLAISTTNVPVVTNSQKSEDVFGYDFIEEH
jgi:hypothetical protein